MDFILIVAGCIFLILGLLLGFLIYRGTTVQLFNLLDLSDSTDHLSKGTYNISIVGGNVISAGNFRIRLNLNGENIPVHPYLIPAWTYIGLSKAHQLYYFEVEKEGVYTVNIEYPRDLVVKQSLTPVMSSLQSPIQHEYLKIAIKKKQSPLKIILSILLVVIAFILLMLGIS